MENRKLFEKTVWQSLVCDACTEAPDGRCSAHSEELQPNFYKGQSIAVLTSGGDAQGMNAAVRAVVRFGKYLGCKVYFIKEGYQGLVDGNCNIVEAGWSDVSGIMNKGGTFIGSARCMEFRERDGRLRAAKNLVDRSITNLVVIGGDGSLTGANLFRNEWPDLVQDLVSKGQITADQADANSHLNIVGMVGSIDNDFCGTDMTIGTDSALHRIIEAVDAIIPTASSHQRTFIMEVMGRHCGYLALVAAKASEADFVFIPEFPPAVQWPEKLCKKLHEARAAGQRLNIIIVAEGAIDRAGKPITCEQVKNVIIDNLHQDTRVTVLGHIQRGGAPSAFDRILGCRMGSEAVLALMEAKPDSEAVVVTLEYNAAVRVPLMDCVRTTQSVAKAMEEGNWDLAVKLRGKSFQRNLDTYLKLAMNQPKLTAVPVIKSLKFAVLHVGAPCCGINAAVRSFVRNCILKGHQAVGVQNGFEGFFAGNFVPLNWETVTGWAPVGGAKLGTKRTIPGDKLHLVAQRLREQNISGILIIGGFEGFHSALQLSQNRRDYPEFRIPIVVLPATISNNVPGTEFCLGSDTALNEISKICEKVRQSASGTKRRVFMLEVMGGNCGYLATMAGIAGGADAAYIPEEKFGIKDLMNDLNILKSKMELGHIQRGLILINERANKNYTTNFISDMFAEEGVNIFSVRQNVLGHMQQGGTPSPFDRNLGTNLALSATHWIVETAEANLIDGCVVTNDPKTVVLLGLRKQAQPFIPVEDLVDEADFENRRSKRQWWLQLRSMMRILARHDSTYVGTQSGESE